MTKRYCINAEPRGFPRDHYTEFDTLYHVTHVADARRLAEDERVRAGLVHDESKLNATRICVAWTSPNTWVHGSMYGNVSFHFPVSALLKGKRFQFLEVMTKYNPDAIRIVAADGVLAGAGDDFNPRELGHPLYLDAQGRWWRDERYNHEIMLADDLSLADCEAITFEDHHGRYCNKYGMNRCPERGREDADAGREFLAFVLGRGVVRARDLVRSGQRSSATVALASEALRSQVRRIVPPNNRLPEVTKRHRRLVRAALLSLSLGRDTLAEACLEHMRGRRHVTAAFEEVLVASLGRPLLDQMEQRRLRGF